MTIDFVSHLRRVDDFPKAGVAYFDASPLFKNPEVFSAAIMQLQKFCDELKVDKIAAIEAKGFVLAGALAFSRQLPLVLIRKHGLTPGECLTQNFEKEYGAGSYQLRVDAVMRGERVLILYDILATAGAAMAAARLVEMSGGIVAGFSFVTELQYLGGRAALSAYPVQSLAKIARKGAA